MASQEMEDYLQWRRNIDPNSCESTIHPDEYTVIYDLVRGGGWELVRDLMEVLDSIGGTVADHTAFTTTFAEMLQLLVRLRGWRSE